MEEKKELVAEIEIPADIKVDLAHSIMKVSGKRGEVSRDFTDKKISMTLDSNVLTIKAVKNNRNNKKQLKTKAAHIRNMLRGAAEGHLYTLKICSGHFPMTVAVTNNELVVKNFLGEKVPRVLPIKKGATVKVEGEKITVESVSLEVAGQVSADIENLTKRPGFDTRIFQDGIYITAKDGKPIA